MPHEADKKTMSRIVMTIYFLRKFKEVKWQAELPTAINKMVTNRNMNGSELMRIWLTATMDVWV
jgi:hypothetical protein